MENNNEILNPVTFYETQLKKSYQENANKLFDELISQSGLNEQENIDTCQKYTLASGKANKIKSKLNGFKTLRVFMFIFFAIFIGIAVALFMLCFDEQGSKNTTLFIVFGVLSVVAAIVLLVLALTIVKKKIHELRDLFNSFDKEANKWFLLAQEQMVPLNALFDWNAPSIIIKRTSPIIELDPYFDIKKYAYLNDKYKFGENTDENASTVITLSGQIVGNPFLLYRNYIREIINKTYTGTLTITYIDHVTDSEGNTHAVTRTQTLHAETVHPAPNYYYSTSLVYANDAAPKLNFSREPSGATGLNEKQVEKKVNKGKKELDKYAKKALMDDDPNTNFTALGNEKFDVLFGAKDRDNEVEFRLLYTPIAQLSTVNLLINGKPFGDDFNFTKRGPLNYISSYHSQRFDYSTSPDRYMSYSVQLSRQAFVEYNTSFIESLYYDLAPLLCIPLYQQHKPFEYIYKDVFNFNYTSYEDETIANAIDASYFMPKNSITSQILKVVNRVKAGASDVITIKSRAFKGINRVDYVGVLGGDGNVHQVPVYWIEYIPIEKTTDMVVKRCDASRPMFDGLLQNPGFSTLMHNVSKYLVYQRGLMGFVLGGTYSSNDDGAISKYFSK